MAKALQFAFSTVTKTVPAANCTKVINLSKQTRCSSKYLLGSHAIGPSSSRTHSSLSALVGSVHSVSKRKPNLAVFSTRMSTQQYSTEVDNEISKFLVKEIQYETSKLSNDLPTIPGFEIVTDGGDITLTKVKGSEKVVVSLSVNGAVDSILSEDNPEKADAPPQMVCRPSFDVEIIKDGGTVFAFQCAFPATEEPFEDSEQYAKETQKTERIDDQFEIQEVAIHGGEWKDTTFSVSTATMDAELFDLLMDMLDERGINDEFISQFVDFCTAYENKQYIEFLKSLKTFTEK